jgi:hypothetical protein
MQIVRLAGLWLICAGCSSELDRQVRAEFTQAQPTATVLDVAAGEGDLSTVYYHIRFRLPNDTTVRVDEWQYMKRPSGRWTNSWRQSTGRRGEITTAKPTDR